MWRKITTGAVETGTVSPPAIPEQPAAPTQTPPAETTLLQRGSTGPAVRELQRILNRAYPSLPALVQDGVFDPETEDRVHHVQICAGLTVDGIVGPRTRGVLNMPEPERIRPAAAPQPAGAPSASVVRPASGSFTSGFGSRWGTSHFGIDIANEIGTPIYATTDGIVISSGPASGFGRWVRVHHDDGVISVYGHINESLVFEGQRVTAGQQIATMGNRGHSTGPHLHFEVWTPSGEKINPAAWLRDHGISVDDD